AATLITLGELLAIGDAAAWKPPPPATEGLDRMTLLIHSSGSTGSPKGVIITERTTKSQWELTPGPVIRTAFAPLNHMAGRHMIYNAFARGGYVNFTATRDLSTVFEDIRLTRPTEVMAFPRILELVHHHFLSEVVRRTGGEASETDTDAVRAEVMAEMRA